MLVSEKAFDSIEYIGADIAEKEIWYPKKEIRDKNARKEYFNSRQNCREKGDIYITTILDGEIKENDKRLR